MTPIAGKAIKKLASGDIVKKTTKKLSKHGLNAAKDVRIDFLV